MLFGLTGLLTIACRFLVVLSKCIELNEHKNYHLLDHEDGTTCGHSHVSRPGGKTVVPRVSAGRDAGLGEFPWVTQIEVLRGTGKIDNGTEVSDWWKCTGTLINDRYVLTAAHCVNNDPLEVKVILGELDERTEVDCEGNRCSPPSVQLHPEQITLHPDYNSTNYPYNVNDIALVRLDQQVIFNGSCFMNYWKNENELLDFKNGNKNVHYIFLCNGESAVYMSDRISLKQYVRPICLPMSCSLRENSYKDSLFKFAGWGATQEDPGLYPKILQKLTTTEISCDCSSESWVGDVTLEEICTLGSVSQRPLGGDSGGPLMSGNIGLSQYTLVGLNSFFAKCLNDLGKKEVKNFYTRVSFFVPWILDNITE